MKLRTILVLMFFVVSLPGYSLSPPQYTFQRELLSSIGASPHVTVNDIVEENDVYRIDVIADDPAIGSGLAFILKDQINFGGISVTVRVLDAKGNVIPREEIASGVSTAENIRTHFLNALRDNPYLNAVSEIQEDFLLYSFWLEFKPAVIQFWNDNLGDYYGNYNAVAAVVFQEVIREEFSDGTGQSILSVGYTTTPVKSDSTVPFFQTYH